MKLLFLSGINAFGRQEVFQAQLAKGLSHMGIEVHVAFPPNQGLSELLKELKLTSFTYPFSGQFDLGTVNNISGLVKNNNCVIVHTYGTRSGYLRYTEARKSGTSAKAIHQMIVPTNLFTRKLTSNRLHYARGLYSK
jgi:hypothetical protein